jgi:hypothetical protein
MELMEEILIRRTNHSKIHEVDFEHLEFGKYVSDHMLICDFRDGKWHQPANSSLCQPFAESRGACIALRSNSI